jgi:hypothetical protein
VTFGKFAALALVLIVAALDAPAALAGADTEPVIVVPGRRGVPIIVQGQDVSGAVIEGEWGLARGHTGITIIQPRPFYPWPDLPAAAVPPPRAGHFSPGTGRPPRVGRLEVIPPANRRLPPPAPDFYREWGTQSAPLPPTTLDAPYDRPIIGPGRYGGRHGPYRNWQ